MANHVKPYAIQLLQQLRGEISAAGDDAQASVDIAEVIAVKPRLILQPLDGEATYDTDDLLWNISPKGLKKNDLVTIGRDPAGHIIVFGRPDELSPNPTEHPAGAKMQKQLTKIRKETASWKAPKYTVDDLPRTDNANGDVRLVTSKWALYVWKDAKESWEPLTDGAGALVLDELTDVTITTPAAAQFLRYDGASWLNAAVAQSDVTGLTTDLALKASLASPALTGTPTAPTVAITSNNTSIATTAAVSTALAGYSPSIHTHIAANVTDFDTAADARIAAQKALANGLATLDGGGKVPASQLPSSLMEYQGNWNASTNSPALADGTADNAGNVYRVSVGATRNLGSGNIVFDVGDYAVCNTLGVWEKSDTTDAVASFNGRTGAVAPASADYTVSMVTGAAPLTSPTFLTSAFAPTVAVTTNNTNIATTAAVTTALSSYLTSATAASTYLTSATAASTYLTTATAASTYQATSTKGVANGYASLDANTRVPTAQLGTGTANSSSYLRGDGAWATVTGSRDGVLSVSTSTTLTAANPRNIVFTGSFNQVLTLPAAVLGLDFTIINRSTTGYRVQVVPAGTETIDGLTTTLYVAGGAQMSFVATGTGTWARYSETSYAVSTIKESSAVGTYSAAPGEIVRVDSTANATMAIELPANHRAGQTVTVKDVVGKCGTNIVTVTTSDTDTIDGVQTYVLTYNYEAAIFVSDGANWMAF